jgi:hypothetical protein
MRAEMNDSSEQRLLTVGRTPIYVVIPEDAVLGVKLPSGTHHTALSSWCEGLSSLAMEDSLRNAWCKVRRLHHLRDCGAYCVSCTTQVFMVQIAELTSCTTEEFMVQIAELTSCTTEEFRVRIAELTSCTTEEFRVQIAKRAAWSESHY